MINSVSPTPSTGTPIIANVNGKNLVISGNGRTLVQKLIYSKGHGNPTTAAANVAHLIKNAHEFGLSPDKVEKFKNPILVRRLTDKYEPEELHRIARVANKAEGTTLVPSEVAAGLVSGLGGVLNNFSTRTYAHDNDKNKTLSKLLETNTKLRKDVLQAAEGIRHKAQSGVERDDSQVSPEGVNTLADAILGMTFGEGSNEKIAGLFTEGSVPHKRFRYLAFPLFLLSQKVPKIKESLGKALYDLDLLYSDVHNASGRPFAVRSGFLR